MTSFGLKIQKFGWKEKRTLPIGYYLCPFDLINEILNPWRVTIPLIVNYVYQHKHGF